MGFYDNIDKEEEAQDRGAFARAGRYMVLVNRIRSGFSKKLSSDFVAVDMTVLAVLPDGEEQMKLGQPGEPWIVDPQGAHNPGELISVMFQSKHASAKRNYKTFVAAAVGVEPDDVTPEFCSKVESDELLSGEVLELNNKVIETNAGNPFTKVWVQRPVQASEYSQLIDENTAERFFPEGFEALIAAEG